MSATKRLYTEERCTAFHEAGHAVMAHLLGLPVKRASIEPDDNGTLGRVHHSLGGVGDETFYGRPMSTWKVDRIAMVAMAGGIAAIRARRNGDDVAAALKGGGRSSVTFDATLATGGRDEVPVFPRGTAVKIVMQPRHWTFRPTTSWVASRSTPHCGQR